MVCNKAKNRIVYGNTKNVVIELKELVDVKTGETQPFDIEQGDVVTVYIKGRGKTREYAPTVDGNMLSFKIGPELKPGEYVIEVDVKRGADSYVSRKLWQLSIVLFDNEAGIPDDAEFTTEDLELIAVMYIKGDPMTYDDMTEEQKEDLADRMGAKLFIDDDGYLNYGELPKPHVKVKNSGTFGWWISGIVNGDKLEIICTSTSSVSGANNDGLVSGSIASLDNTGFYDFLMQTFGGLGITSIVEGDTFDIGDTIPDWESYEDIGE